MSKENDNDRSNKFRAIPVVTALAVVATLALSAPVHAGVVTINVDRDTLSPEDQRAARITLENTLESHGIMPIGAVRHHVRSAYQAGRRGHHSNGGWRCAGT